jgi:hypothetical protein
MDNEGWHILEGDPPVLWREYRFTKTALATTFAFRGQDGLVVVSPGMGCDDRAYDALREHGPVSALVANNVMHHLGQGAWRARFPEAVSYAPAGAIDTLKKKVPGVAFRPLGDLALPDHAESADPPGFKTGEAFFRVRTGQGNVWFTGDLLANLSGLPPPPLRWLFSWTSSGPGFRLFKPAVWLMVRDRKALRRWMLDRAASDAPSVIVPAHGRPLETGDVAAIARAQLERL